MTELTKSVEQMHQRCIVPTRQLASELANFLHAPTGPVRGPTPPPHGSSAAAAAQAQAPTGPHRGGGLAAEQQSHHALATSGGLASSPPRAPDPSRATRDVFRLNDRIPERSAPQRPPAVAPS